MQSHDLKSARATYAVGWVAALLILLATVPNVNAATGAGWPILDAALKQKSSGQTLAAVRVLALIPDDPHAMELAESALSDPSVPVRAAAATALGQMHASAADTALKLAYRTRICRW
jgi:HEAT repeat protein